MSSKFPEAIVNPSRRKAINIIAWVITGIVLIVVGGMRQIKFDTPIDFSWLSGFHSTVNGITAIVLVYGLMLVKRKKYALHLKAMMIAMILSAVFLLSYVIYHTTTEEVRYCGEGTIRYLYFVLLISHVVIAGIIFPFILFTFVRAITGQYERHRKMAKYVFPFWMYVAVTGPILYLMLMPCFN